MTAVYPVLATILITNLVLAYTIWLNHKERVKLLDRIIAMSNPEASVMVHAQEVHEPGNVTYIDEAAEYRLSANGTENEAIGR